MAPLFRYLAYLAIVIASVSQASASSITEEFTAFYSSPGAFTISDLFFGSGSNLIPSNQQNPGTVSGGAHSLFSDTFALDTGLTYTFSFGGTYAGSDGNIKITGAPQSFFAGQSGSGFGLYIVGGALSPVPLPASFPLFALALVSLAAIAFQTRRRRIKAGTTALSVSDTPRQFA